MSDVKTVVRAGWHRLARTAAYALMPKFTAGAVVVARDDTTAPARALLVRKRSGGELWGFPGGYVGYRTSIVQTARRELTQETGVRAHITLAGHLRSYQQPWAMHLDHLFLVAASGEPSVHDAMEIAEAAWWPVDRLPPLAREAMLALRELPDVLTRPVPDAGRIGRAGHPGSPWDTRHARHTRHG